MATEIATLGKGMIALIALKRADRVAVGLWVGIGGSGSGFGALACGDFDGAGRSLLRSHELEVRGQWHTTGLAVTGTCSGWGEIKDRLMDCEKKKNCTVLGVELEKRGVKGM